MKKHAMLSASGASRWLVCAPSARLEAELYTGSGKEISSVYADEGTLAHELGEWLIRAKGFGIELPKKLAEIRANPLYNDEMEGYCQDYADFVIERVRSKTHKAILIQEQRLNLTEFIPEGFGTTDNAIISEPEMEIIDLKYGKGVPVDSYENPQLMVYGLGALMEYDLTYNIRQIKLTIYQPRIDNISTYEISTDNLIRWGHETLRPGAEKAYNGDGELIPGDHCRFCKVRATCVANAKYNLKLAARDFNPVELSDEQVVKILERTQSIKQWLSTVEEHALRSAINGKKWPGMKLVRGRSVRQYTDEQLILNKLLEAGEPVKDVVTVKLKGITELTKSITKERFKEIVEPNLVKPLGKPTLVFEGDGRPEIDANEGAAAEFGAIGDASG